MGQTSRKNSKTVFLKEERMIARALQNVVYPIGEEEGSITVKDILAELRKDIDIGESTLYHWIENGTIPGWAMIKIQKLAAQHEEDSLLMMAVPKGYVLVPVEESSINGSLDDEIAEATEALGDTNKKLRADNFKGARGQVRLLRKVANKIEAEIEAKENKRR